MWKNSYDPQYTLLNMCLFCLKRYLYKYRMHKSILFQGINFVKAFCQQFYYDNL